MARMHRFGTARFRIVQGLCVGTALWWGVSALVVIASGAEPTCCGYGPVDAATFHLTAARTGNAGNAQAVDVRAKVRSMQPKEGLNFIDSAGGLKLYGRFEHGKFVEFQLFDMQGRRVPSQISRRVNAQGETTCWQCGKDESGNTHCWVIPCPVIKGPWTPTKTAR